MDFRILVLTLFSSIIAVNSLKQGECEGKICHKILEFIYIFFFLAVCVKVLDRFRESLSDSVKSEPKKIEEEFRAFCKAVKKDKENRFVSVLKCPPIHL